MCKRKTETFEVAVSWWLTDPEEESSKVLQDRFSNVEGHTLQCKSCFNLLASLRGYIIPKDIPEKAIQRLVKLYTKKMDAGLGIAFIPLSLKPPEETVTK
jgi:hypothetical protein